MRLRYGLLIALGLGLGIGIPLFLGGRDLLPLLNRVSAGELLTLLGMIFLGWNLNAGRLRLLAGGASLRLSQGQALATVMATEFAICATPAGSGGPLTYAWLLRRHGLGTPRALALYAADQLMDVLFFLTALGAVLLHWLIVPEDVHLAWQLALMLSFLLSTLGLVWFSIRHYRPLFLALGRLLRRLQVGPKVRRRLVRRALEFRRSLRLVQGYPRARLAAVYVLCTGHWLLRYSILYLAVRALGGGISWSYAFLVQMLSLTAGQATLLPGGSGGAEASSSLLLAPYLDSATTAAAILVWRFVTFYWYLIAGAPVFAAVAGRALWKRLWARPASAGE